MYRNTHKSLLLGGIGIGLVLLTLVGTILSSIQSVNATESNPNDLAMAWQDGATPGAAATMNPLLQSDLKILSGNVQRPNGITFFDGYLYTSCSGDFTVYRLDADTGDTVTYIAGVQNTHTLYIEQGDDGPVIWVADFQRNALSYIQTEPRALENVKQGLGSPWGLAPAADGSFYVTQFATDDIVNIKRDGTLNVTATGFRNPTGIVVDGNYIYVGNNGSARRAIEYFEYTPGSAPVTEQDLKPLVSGLQNVTTIVTGPDNWLYFAYSLGTRGIVGRVNPQTCRDKGGCINADVEIVLWSELSAPLAGLVIAPDMRLFVHTMFGSEIYWAQLPENLNPRPTSS
ncbi:MAG: hypothetical protein HY862_16140 [Chloroflexi bacterium]|nr:hypothetical protein [Chloroflexota bacterium]